SSTRITRTCGRTASSMPRKKRSARACFFRRRAQSPCRTAPHAHVPLCKQRRQPKEHKKSSQKKFLQGTRRLVEEFAPGYVGISSRRRSTVEASIKLHEDGLGNLLG